MIKINAPERLYNPARSLIPVLILLLWLSAAVCQAADDEKKPDADDEPKAMRKISFKIPWFTMSPRIGYAYYQRANLIPGLSLDHRHALLAQYGFDFGGEGFTSEVTPLYQFESIPGSSIDQLHALGLYLGVNWRWRWWNFVPSSGFGVRTSILLSEDIDYGLEIFGRIPLSLTWYLTQHYNIIFEIGIAFGATGIRSPGIGLDELHLGHGFALDATVGSRF